MNKDISNIYQLRFILQQPSVNWKDFGLNEIKLRLKNPELDIDTVLDEYSEKCSNKIINLDVSVYMYIYLLNLKFLYYLCNRKFRPLKTCQVDYKIYGIYARKQINKRKVI